MAKNPRANPIDRTTILNQIAESMQAQGDYDARNSGYMNEYLRKAASEEAQKRMRLKDLLGLVDSQPSGGSGSSWSNPFGGASGGAAGGVPTMPTDNRFATGLSDAESRLRSLLDNPDSINQSAAYKFRVNQGQEALQRSLGAKGMLNSGNRLMELTKYGQDMGSQEYDNQYNRLGSLVGNYSQGYTADRNANTNQFAAKANAWNTAQGNQDRVNIAEKEIWSKRNPVPIPGINNGYRWV